MSSLPPAPPPPYGSPAPGSRPRIRGRIPLRLALIFGVIGVALCVTGILVLVHAPFTKTDEFARVPVDGQPHNVQLSRTGGYVGYFETPSAGSHTADVRLRIVGPDGSPVTLRLYGRNGATTSSLTYDLNGRHSEALYTFSIERAGTYQVGAQSGNAPAGSRIALGESVADGIALGVLLFIPGLLLVIAAVVLLIVGLVKRSRHKRELASAYGWH